MKHMRYQFLVMLASLGLWAEIASGQNQNNNNGAQQFRGIVTGGADDLKSFTMIDRQGNILKIPVGPGTAYDSNRQAVNFAGAIVYGMEIRGTYAPDGSAATVSARGQATEIEDEQLQAFMGASEDEWVVLKPKIDRVQTLLDTLDPDSGGGNNSGGNQGQRNALVEAKRALQSSFFNPMISPGQLRTTLSSMRQERSRAQSELTQVRAQLQNLVTTRQEVLLVMMGILE